MDAPAAAAMTKEPPKPPVETVKLSSVLQVEHLLKELNLGEIYDDKTFAAANHAEVCFPHAQFSACTTTMVYCSKYLHLQLVSWQSRNFLLTNRAHIFNEKG